MKNRLSILFPSTNASISRAMHLCQESLQCWNETKLLRGIENNCTCISIIEVHKIWHMNGVDFPHDYFLHF